MSNYDIFISYREDGGIEIAQKIYEKLIKDNYTVSFAAINFNTGRFDKQIFERLKSCTDFIIILDEHVFDRCLNDKIDPKKDWLRRELAYALKHKKNIISIKCPQFRGFPKDLPNNIAGIEKENFINYFDVRTFNCYTYKEIKKNLKTPNKKILLLTTILIISLVLIFSFLYVKCNLEETSSYEKIQHSKSNFEQYECNYDNVGKQNNLNLVKMYEESANSGNANAMNYIGSAYYWGNGVPKNYYKAVEFYTKAAKNGNINSMYNLGHCFMYGNGVEKDYAKAVFWFKKSALSGNTSAMYNLGHCYKYGKGISKDYFKAAIWNMKAAELGNTYAMNEIGNCYYFGEGLSKNYSKALEWYEKAALQGNFSKLNNIIICYDKGYGTAANQNIADSLRKAVKELHKGNSVYAKTLVNSVLK